MIRPPFAIIYEDNHLLVVNKPAGLPTMGVRGDRRSVVSLLRHYIKTRDQKTGNVFLGVVSRLDTPVTGVVILAKTTKAARRLNEQFRAGSVLKTYGAVIEKCPDPREGQWSDWLVSGGRHGRARLVEPEFPEAKQAVTQYRVLRYLADKVLVELQPVTGRKHQLRAQLAARGLAIWGDRKYGSRKRFPVGLALHARRLELSHPISQEPLVLEAPLPLVWNQVGIKE